MIIYNWLLNKLYFQKLFVLRPDFFFKQAVFHAVKHHGKEKT